MIGKYTQVVDANWDDRALFAESVPHLFHFDLLYLWMLEKDPDRRSRDWSDRIAGWRYLVSLFLLGDLRDEHELIREPFLKYTLPFGIDRVSWLKAGSQDQLGVLSPTVLVRPLPDFTGDTLHRWLPIFGDLSRREPEIRHFVDLAVDRLMEGESKALPSYRTRLAAVLEREFGRGKMASHPAGRNVSIPVLRSLGWARPRLAAEGPTSVTLLVGEVGDPRVRIYVPRCSACNELLTRTKDEEPVAVRDSSVQLICPNGHANNLSLDDFLIWYRGKGQVIVWRDERQVLLEKGAPPQRTIQNIRIDMEWNAGHVADDRRRFLNLSFPEMTVREHRLDEIFFEKVLIPGRLEGFRGLPIRPEWIDVLLNPHSTSPEVDPSAPKIAYRDLRLGGWPVVVPRVFGGMSLQMREDLAVGLYPDPAKVGPDWRWFRVFLDGPGRVEHRLSCKDNEPVLPWIGEVKSGVPGLVSVELVSDSRTGATFSAGGPAGTTAALATGLVRVGVDFGTSNSLIGFYRTGYGGSLGEAVTLVPETLLDMISWLAAPANTVEGWEGATGDFLPPRGYRGNTDDPHIVPSALWRLMGQQIRYLVRWDSQRPSPQAQPLSGFKWDPPRTGSLARERQAFLQEVLLLSLPAIIAETAQIQRVTDVHLGFAFPLAFDHTARKGMLSLLETLRKDFLPLTGLRLQFVHLDESAACMNAFGMFEHGESFLVADMGGGTLDLALFTAGYEGKTELHHIGSLRFAGEDGVQSLASKKGSTSPDDDTAWRLRDLITHGKARSLYGNDLDAQKIVTRLVSFAFEYLRTMIAAFRKQHGQQQIRVVLVGNGWHLADAFSDRARQRGMRSFFSEFYRHFLNQLGESGLELYEKDPLRKLPGSKHLVVRGALENTVDTKRQELRDEASLSRLPAGRSMTFGPPQRNPIQVGWDRVLGEDESAALQGVASSDLRPEHLRIDVQDMPPLEPSWRLVLLEAFAVNQAKDIPYPDEAQLRRAVGRSIEHNRIGRGPLQVILEERWREELSR